jgi:hypothetical protein
MPVPDEIAVFSIKIEQAASESGKLLDPPSFGVQLLVSGRKDRSDAVDAAQWLREAIMRQVVAIGATGGLVSVPKGSTSEVH